jgi:D-2-hydroxyacid dehydrogenase (NADP+)
LETASINLLMSDQARERLQGRIEALASRVSPQRLIYFVETNTNSADIAFVSRDVTGRSTKQIILPDTRVFYDTLSNSPKLRWLNIHSAGMDRQIYQELARRGVTVTTSQGNNAKIVAQTALTGLLSLARRFPFLSCAQRAHDWAPLHDALMPRDLAGQTAVIIGWGEIGKQLAEYLAMLELNIIIVRNQAQVPAGRFETTGLEQFKSVLPRADWLIIACPLTAKTQSLINEESLSLLPKSAYLINVARGQIVDEDALVRALQRRDLGGAFLDVFEHEPLPPNSALWDLPNVIVTPHSAGFSDGNEARVDEMFLYRLEQWLRGWDANLSA